MEPSSQGKKRKNLSVFNIHQPTSSASFLCEESYWTRWFKINIFKLNTRQLSTRAVSASRQHSENATTIKNIYRATAPRYQSEKKANVNANLCIRHALRYVYLEAERALVMPIFTIANYYDFGIWETLNFQVTLVAWSTLRNDRST